MHIWPDVICDSVLLPLGTCDLCLSPVLWSGGEQELPVVASRQGSILDAVVVNVSLAGFPLQRDAVICQLNCLQVFWGIKVYGNEQVAVQFQFSYILNVRPCLNSYTVAYYELSCSSMCNLPKECNITITTKSFHLNLCGK